MYVPSRQGRAHSAAAVLGIIALCLITPVCGTTLLRGTPSMSPRDLALPPSGIAGVGINCHSQELPVDKLRDIGIRWVRIDLTGRDYSYSKIRPLVDYYHGFGQLWILPQTAPFAADEAKALIDAGVTDIEVFNEPDMAHISAAEYARSFQIVKNAVGSKARLYGPATGTWEGDKRYVEECVRQGMRPDVLSFHGYSQTRIEQLADWVADAKHFGLPVVISELGYPTYLGKQPYRVVMHQNMGELFVRTKQVLGDTPWCFYDGPNPDGNGDSGLFDMDARKGKFVIPNHNYRDIVAATKS